MAVIPKFVGERVMRREDPRLISGTSDLSEITLIGIFFFEV